MSELRNILAKYMPPLSPSQAEEILAAHERIVAAAIESTKAHSTRRR
jgi:hypothetical protein